MPTSALQAVQPKLQKRVVAAGMRGSGMGLMGLWGPVADGKVIPSSPFDPAAPAISADIPMIIGTCMSEFVNGVDNPERDTLAEQELLRRSTERWKDNGAAIVAAYRKEYPKASPFDLWTAIATAGVRQAAVAQAERKVAQKGAPVYMYLYVWRTPMLGGKIGTFHSSEITFAFDNAVLCPHYSGATADAIALSAAMGEAWASFARSGKPGSRGLPEWPAYDAHARATMIFDIPSAVRQNPEGEGLRLIPPRPFI